MNLPKFDYLLIILNFINLTVSAVRVNLIALHAFPCCFVEKVVGLAGYTLSLALTLQTRIDARSAVLNVGIKKMPNITLEAVLFRSTFFT